MNKIETEYKSELKIESIFINNTSFSRKEEALPSKLNMSFAFRHQVVDIDDTTFKITLTGELGSSDDFIRAEAAAIALFTLETDTSDESIIETLKNNAVAIMFPYLRSQFTLISSQSGVLLTMPPVNINAYLEAHKERRKQH